MFYNSDHLLGFATGVALTYICLALASLLKHRRRVPRDNVKR